MTAESAEDPRNGQARARLAAIVTSSTDAIVGQTLEGIVTDWNRAAERLYGYSAAEVIGQHISMLIPAERMPEAENVLARVRQGEHTAVVDAERWTKDGRRLDVSLSVSPVWDDAGEMIGTSAIVRDVTDRAATERALAASEALLRVAFENAPIGMILTSPEGRMLRVNRAICEMLGYTPDELLATRTWAFTHAEDVQRNQDFMRRALSGELDSYQFEKRYLHRDGQTVWGHLSGSLVRDETGDPLYFVSQIQNITERRASDHALAAIEERFRIAFTDAPIGMALVAADQRILQVNRALCAMLGYAEAELTGTTLRSHTHPDDIAANHALVERARAGEVDRYTLEKRYLRKDGQIVWAALTASCVRDETGFIRYYISQIADITESKVAEAQLAEAHHETQQVLERITDSFYALDREFRFTYVNEAAEQMMAKTRGELLGQSLWEAFPAAIETPLYAAFHEAAATGASVTLEFYYPPFDHWAEVRAYPSTDGLSVFFRDVTARRQLVHELRASEEKLQNLVDQVPAVIYLLAADEHQSPLYVGPRLEAMTGYTTAETLGTPERWLERVHPEDRDRVAAETARTMAAGEPFRMEYRYVRKDGSVFWVQDECVPVHDDSGQLTAWHGVLLDVTERKLAEVSLRESEARFRAIWDATADAIALSDPEGIVLSANHAYGALYGYPPEAIIGQPFSIIFPEVDREAANAQYRELFLGQQPSLSYETTVQRADGTQSEVEARAAFITIDGQRQAMVSSIRDVTDRARLEKELQASEEKFRSLVDRLPAVVYVLANDEQQTPVYFSPYIEALTGYTPEEALARTGDWLDKIHPDDRARVNAEGAHLLASGKPLRIEYRFCRKDGRFVWVVDEAAAIRDDTDVIVGIHGVLLDISDRVQAEEERARLAAIVASAEDGILSCTLDGTITSWNSGAERLYGYRSEEAIGRSVTMLRPPELDDEIAGLMEAVRQGKSIQGHETVRLTSDGQRVNVSLAISPIRDASGRITGIASISRDVTALRKAEAALRLRNRALAATSNGIFITDPTRAGNPIIDVNPAFETLTGYARSEIVSRGMGMLYGQGTDPEAVRRLHEALDSGKDTTETLLGYRKDGTPFWNELHVAAVRDDAGRLTHYVGVQSDVSERVKAEAALRESEARFRGVWENTRDALAVSDAEGIVLAANPAYGELYGYPLEAIVGQLFSVIFPDAERTAAEALHHSLFADPSPPASFEATIQRMDGGAREVEARASFIEVDGERQAMISAIRDVTDRKRLEHELRHALEGAQAATRTKSLFLAMMSHELRTPLQAVLGYTDLLLLGPADSLTSEQQQDLGYVRGGATRMMTLIDQLLDLSRMEAGRLELAVKPVDLVQVIEHVRQDIAPQIAAKGLDLHIDLPLELPPVLGDPGRLRQILLNLASNAVKFTDAGSVSIRVRSTEDRVDIDVTDTGIGITPEAIPLIFEEFRQVDGNLSRRYGGAGLGLAIAHKLAEQMGGAITVISQHGSSSTFTLRIPVAA